MPATTYFEPTLLRQFRAFYAEITRLKQHVQSGTWIFLVDTLAQGDSDTASAEQAVWQQVVALLEEQAPVDGQPMSAAGSALSRDVQYVMTVFADEVFMHLPWSGKEMWKAKRLEQRLFGTVSDGVLFFDQINHLLQERNPVYTDVASVYLMALALGYRGTFWGSDDGGRIDLYRRQLFQFIFQRKSDLLDESARLFPDAYNDTVTDGKVGMLPPTRKWVMALALASLMWLGISYGMWRYVTHDSFAVAQEIINVGEAR